MRVATQLAVFLENRPGTLAEVCAALAEKDVNVRALTVSDTVDHAVVRLVVDAPDVALHVLGESNMLVVESDVVALEVANRSGALAEVARKLGENDINIEYAYCTALEGQDTGLLVLRVKEAQRALDVLQRG